MIKELRDISALTHPQPNCTNYELVIDSQNYDVGAVLLQIVEENPILFGFSPKNVHKHQPGILPFTGNF